MGDSAFGTGSISRRGFLQSTAVAAGAVALTGFNAYAQDEEAGGEERIGHCVCRGNCFGFCNLNAHVRDGRIVKTSKFDLPEHPEYSRICQRGLTHPERIYNDKRIKYPMRRVEGTERGAGQWERISWDEAISEIASKMKEYRAAYGDESVAFMGLSGNYGQIVSTMYTRFMSLINATFVQPNNDIAYCVPASRYFGMAQLQNNEPTNWMNAKTILFTGCNLTDANVHVWHFAKEAQANGAKIVVIDPVYSVLASKADQWIPIRPGSDTLLYFGIINIMKEQGMIDEAYMADRTVAPFLVRSDTGLFLRRSDTGIEPENTGVVDEATGEPVMFDPYMVLENEVLVTVDEATAPELYAEYDFNGIKCTTALKVQMDEIAQWTPDLVSEKTDIPVDVIYELADYYNAGLIHAMGYGPINYYNGEQMSAAATLAQVLTGKLGTPGVDVGPLYQALADVDYSYSYPCVNETVPFVLIDWVNIAQGAELVGKPRNLKMAYFYCGNPMHTAPTTGDWRDIIVPSLEYIVVADSAMTDTASFADLVLPIAQQFEYYDVVPDTYGGIACNEKCIEPPFEAKSDADIVRLLAKEMGLDEYFTESDDEICRIITETPGNVERGITWDRLKEVKWIRTYGDEPFVAYTQETFATPSGRIEFYCEHPAVVWGRVTTKVPTEEDIQRARLTAHWQEPSEDWYEKDIMKKYPLSFLSQRNRFRVHSQFFTVEILKEIVREPLLFVNPGDAQARGIEDGSYVEAFNDRGHAVGKAVYSEAVRPGSVLYPKGWQIPEFKAGNWSELLNPDFSMWSTANNFADAVCDIRPWVEEGEN